MRHSFFLFFLASLSFTVLFQTAKAETLLIVDDSLSFNEAVEQSNNITDNVVIQLPDSADLSFGPVKFNSHGYTTSVKGLHSVLRYVGEKHFTAMDFKSFVYIQELTIIADVKGSALVLHSSGVLKMKNVHVESESQNCFRVYGGSLSLSESTIAKCSNHSINAPTRFNEMVLDGVTADAPMDIGHGSAIISVEINMRTYTGNFPALYLRGGSSFTLLQSHIVMPSSRELPCIAVAESSELTIGSKDYRNLNKIRFSYGHILASDGSSIHIADTAELSIVLNKAHWSPVRVRSGGKFFMDKTASLSLENDQPKTGCVYAVGGSTVELYNTIFKCPIGAFVSDRSSFSSLQTEVFPSDTNCKAESDSSCSVQ